MKALHCAAVQRKPHHRQPISLSLNTKQCCRQCGKFKTVISCCRRSQIFWLRTSPVSASIAILLHLTASSVCAATGIDGAVKALHCAAVQRKPHHRQPISLALNTKRCCRQCGKFKTVISCCRRSQIFWLRTSPVSIYRNIAASYCQQRLCCDRYRWGSESTPLRCSTKETAPSAANTTVAEYEAVLSTMRQVQNGYLLLSAQSDFLAANESRVCIYRDIAASYCQ